MEKSITAILIKAEEHKESDYLVRLFSTEGIVVAVLRGVRKAGAKMKFAAQPMAFCVYELTGNKFPVVTGASQIEDFSSVCADMIQFTCCMIMLEAADYSSAAVDCAESFLSLLKSIKTIIYSSVDARLAATKFLQKLLYMSGFFRPERKKGPVVDAQSLSAAIAASYLDELPGLVADNELINAALKLNLAMFERFFSCKINSGRFFS